MDLDADLSALNRLSADLGKAGPRVIAGARKVLEVTSANIDRDAKIFAPVDTGNLRNSISREVSGLSAEIGASAEYAAHVEFGTSRMAPSAFLGPALDRHSPDFEKAMGLVIAKAIDS